MYATRPTKQATEKERNFFYNLIDKTPQKDILMVMVEFRREGRSTQCIGYESCIGEKRERESNGQDSC